MIGKFYSIQPSRTSKGIPEGRILILYKSKEARGNRISHFDAKMEGGYTPDGFEELYEKMYPDWRIRWAYTFKFVPKRKRK
jgi:hypothetical protein